MSPWEVKPHSIAAVPRSRSLGMINYDDWEVRQPPLVPLTRWYVSTLSIGPCGIMIIVRQKCHSVDLLEMPIQGHRGIGHCLAGSGT